MKETLKIRIQRNNDSPNLDIVAASVSYISPMGHNDAIIDSETQIHDSGYTFKYVRQVGSLD